MVMQLVKEAKTWLRYHVFMNLLTNRQGTLCKLEMSHKIKEKWKKREDSDLAFIKLFLSVSQDNLYVMNCEYQTTQNLSWKSEVEKK